MIRGGGSWTGAWEDMLSGGGFGWHRGVALEVALTMCIVGALETNIASLHSVDDPGWWVV